MTDTLDAIAMAALSVAFACSLVSAIINGNAGWAAFSSVCVFILCGYWLARVAELRGWI